MSFLQRLQKLNRPVYALLAVAAIAGVLRFWNLSYPSDYVFDEIYYAKDACLYDGYSWKTCHIESEGERYWVKERDEVGSWVHPPAGKWMIAIGEKAFGHSSFGWRFSSALFGTATCVIVAGIALLLFRSALWSFVAGLLMATENLSFVMSRVALLDVFLAFWVSLGFLFLVLDRRWIHQRGVDEMAAAPEPSEDDARADAELMSGSQEIVPARTSEIAELTEEQVAAATVVVVDDEDLSEAGADDGARPGPGVATPLWRPWRFAMGLAFGMAVATKWSGAFALVGAIILSAVWERSRRKMARMPHPWLSALTRESLGMILSFVLVPLGVYLVAYARWWTLNGFDLDSFWAMHTAAAEFHATLDRLKPKGGLTHPYSSQPWDWFILRRPVNFFFQGPPDQPGNAEILAVGNPMIFWGSLVALPYAAWSWIKRRDPRCGFIVVGVLAQYLPWFLWSNRVQFLFYMMPVVPFMVLACVYGVKRIADTTRGSNGVSYLATGLVGASVVLFIFFWPVLTAFPLVPALWDWRIWFKGNWF